MRFIYLICIFAVLLPVSSSLAGESIYIDADLSPVDPCCCLGQRGNVDCSEIEDPDISDITRLIDHLYLSHDELCCIEEADADGSGGHPDISDITAVISHLYIAHDELSECNYPVGSCCFGQRPPGPVAALFAEDILTIDRIPHSGLTFSPDCSEIFWSQFYSTIHYSTCDGVILSEPQIPPFANQTGDAGPSFSVDGNRLFFSSNRQVTQFPGVNPSGIWYTDRTETGWTEPVPIDVTVDTNWYTGAPTAAASGNLYFLARLKAEYHPKIYCCEYIDGNYAEPELLAGDINTAVDQIDPFVDPEEQFLLFSGFPVTKNPATLDIFISFRQPDETWGAPVALSDAVSTDGNMERFPTLSRDGKNLFFVRAIGDHYPGDDARFYWISADILEGLKK